MVEVSIMDAETTYWILSSILQGMAALWGMVIIIYVFFLDKYKDIKYKGRPRPDETIDFDYMKNKEEEEDINKMILEIKENSRKTLDTYILSFSISVYLTIILCFFGLLNSQYWSELFNDRIVYLVFNLLLISMNLIFMFIYELVEIGRLVIASR